MRILIALDGSKFSEEALQSVLRRDWGQDIHFDVVSVVEPQQGMVDPTLALYGLTSLEDCRTEAHEIVARAANLITETYEDATASTTVRFGAPSAEILRVASERQPDLIVMGSHGRSGFTKFLLGSVAEAVTKSSPCSVEIIRMSSSCNKREAS